MIKFGRQYKFCVILMFSVLFFSACNMERSGAKTDEDTDSTSMIEEIFEQKPDSLSPINVEANTEDLLRAMKSSPFADCFEQGILPEMAEDAPEYAAKLLAGTYGGFIVVDKATMRVILYDHFGRVRKSYGMCCAKNYGTKHKRADSRTPEGFFSVEGIYDSTDWLFTDDNGYTSPAKGQFGPRFIRLKIPVTTQIGIHGTASPWSIGHRSSHGCIRITNENILELVELVEEGMPVIVSPGPRDMRVNKDEGFYIPAVTTGEQKVVIGAPISQTVKDTLHVADEPVDSMRIAPTIHHRDSIAVDTIPRQ